MELLSSPDPLVRGDGVIEAARYVAVTGAAQREQVRVALGRELDGLPGVFEDAFTEVMTANGIGRQWRADELDEAAPIVLRFALRSYGDQLAADPEGSLRRAVGDRLADALKQRGGLSMDRLHDGFTWAGAIDRLIEQTGEHADTRTAWTHALGYNVLARILGDLFSDSPASAGERRGTLGE